MSNLPTIATDRPTLPALTADELDMIAQNRQASKARATMRAYKSALKGSDSPRDADKARAEKARKFPTFEAWCAARGDTALPAAPEIVELYLVTLAGAGAKVATIEQRRAAIGYLHEIAGQGNPCKSPQVKEAMKGIRRGKKAQRPAPKKQIPRDELAQIVAAIPDDLRGRRDRAMLLMGWAGAFRRSELAGVQVEHVTIRRERGGEVMSIELPASKTDQEGEGLYKTIPAIDDKRVCPIAAYRAWMNAAGVQSGHVFRAIDRWGHLRAGGMDGQEVARVLKARAEDAGYTDAELRRIGAHSLRSGYVTAATMAGANDSDIMEQTGHRSSATLQRYKQMAGKGAQRATLAAFGVRED